MVNFLKKHIKLCATIFLALFIIAFFVPFFTVNRFYKETNEQVIIHLYFYKHVPHAFTWFRYFFQRLLNGRDRIYPLTVFSIVFVLSFFLFFIKNEKFIRRLTSILSISYLVFFALFTSHVIYLRKDFRVGENYSYKFQAYPSIGYYIYALLAVIIIICWSSYIFQIIKNRISQPTKSQRIAELEKQVSELKNPDKKD